ncbi:ABC transporter ATP-binding protein [Parvimonas micra]|uniref:ABC transporter ATP-binding protein/permease n=1 Tax=Parvimonas micra TaxID=33033 RepID=A0A9X3HG83_9FIRM|nr:ABC transporter ATP-binding protein [Parvimonas micra]MCZ7408142.1 ABC transporter ATP-binding protein/permease [Parvimonas micra]MCZ7411164.1 ABC transporter ATP-binding protein/permease [Parvimonas micra]MCZ7411931.1 ABC transporter ATP-binding protein/permease [Parvimonas micra]WBB37013.1 ABC transporter ATP-binding protein/permease [Parvimonas micra]
MKNKKKSILKRLMPYAGKKSILFYIAMIMSAISGIMVLMPMVFIHRIINSLILNETVDFVYVRENSIYAATFAGLGLFIYLIGLILSHVFAFEVEDNIIKSSVKKLINKPLGYFDDKESGRIRKVIISGASETHSFLAHQLPDMAMTVISPIVLFVFFFMFDWKLGLVSMVPIIIGMILMSSMMTSETKKMKEEYYEDLSDLSSQTVEYVRGIPVVKTFAQSIESFDKLYSLIIKIKDLVLKLTMSYTNKMSWFGTISTSTAFFLVPVALLLIKFNGNLANVVANSVIYFLIGPIFAVFIMRTATIKQFSYFAELALDKIENILEYDDFIYGDKTSSDVGIEFKNVSFSYGEENVLDNISFKVERGEQVALVGMSGSGKTTIARLATRFYDIKSGEILIGGINIKDFEKEALMKKIAFVFQNSKLFKMSLRENLLIAKPDATDEEIDNALINSGCKEIIKGLKNGLDTVYGTRGTYFSGGEAQRLSIARAFLKDADIIILDEATAFADPENEHLIQESFKKLSKNKTTLMIAHRLSTVVDADKILVIDKGRIVEEGKHSDLINMNGHYKKLWDEYQKSVNWKIGG